ncbi:thiamine phosphate synthase [Marinomonas transparens]|uniref:Thiamine-phosphate synthase n=1 Tax=Marinomonas transparens TaxID=2795388 RepID=A0A934JUX9_9GAMM|nr:thiamine phosphate synthase [Marinomonas transparens]MBJ7537739.1 thiamine phosphate synthase [Marinomonas transparens]
MSLKPPVVWCVGGSDSSAHAGLQADLRSGQDLACHVQTIVTCVTAQNSKQVRLVEPVSLLMFNEQWQTLLDDIPPDAIKVSLLPSAELVLACSTWLKRMKADYPNLLVVFDPVMAASSESGNRLQQTSAGMSLLDHILPYVDVITPNLMEFELLTGISGEQGLTELQDSLNTQFSLSTCHWLLKGGHGSSEQATDWLIDKTATIGFSTPRLNVHNTRGTGCTLSTALASFISHGYDLLDAVTMAKAYITGALKSGVKIGTGAGPLGRPGWPLQIENLPEILLPETKEQSYIRAFPAIPAEEIGLYPVVDSVAWLKLVLENGVKTAQLRIKDASAKGLAADIQQAIDLGNQYHARVFINDYWRLAIQYDAYGVHLGQEDLSTANLSEIRKAGLALGISTHGYYEIARAQSIQPSYIALGHIFPTQTKDMPSQPQGLKRLAQYARLLEGHYPTVAIGGIDAERVQPVVQTGVDSVALVTAITKAIDPEAATQSLLTLFAEEKLARNEREAFH